MTQPTNDNVSTRREFLKTSTTVAAGVTMASTLGLAPAVHAAGSDIIKVGVIGCGGRGSGAAENVLQAAPGVEIVAIGDYFKKDDRRGVEPCRQRILDFASSDGKVKELGNKVVLPEERCFVGLDAYKKVIDSGANYIILATPPGFRPLHLQAAVAAGKHVFTEKPVAVDAPGVQLCFNVHAQAKQKGLGIAAGTQRRHQLGYLETMKQIQDGAIGKIVSARCYWNQGPIWFRKRPANMSELDYQIHNWYHFVWLCGDHICEQHVHNLDVVNWAIGRHPVRAVGMGGRIQPCSDPQVDGHIFNSFAIDYEYPDGVHVLSMCRQIADCENSVSEALVGTKGMCQANTYTINGKPVIPPLEARKAANPYVQEHTDLIASIRAGKPINELENVTVSTMTAILGRMSAYTGKAITWDEALASKVSTMPANLGPDSKPPIPAVAVPGKTKLA
jgi:predicted dehydrogenase